jgi:hypothetical protein
MNGGESSGYLPARFAQPVQSVRSTWAPGTFRLRYAKLAPLDTGPAFRAERPKSGIRLVPLKTLVPPRTRRIL